MQLTGFLLPNQKHFFPHYPQAFFRHGVIGIFYLCIFLHNESFVLFFVDILITRKVFNSVKKKVSFPFPENFR